MRDRGKILLGLIAFLVLALFPIWYNLGSRATVRPADLELPEQGGSCVAETEYMRTEHMQLLMEWRDEVVRVNDRIFTTEDGRQYYKSLSNTCMSCHDNKDTFCDNCHNFVGVKPYCWDCHVEPQGAL
jgi:hypothetical protein